MDGSVGAEIKDNARKRKIATLYLSSNEITLVRQLLIDERDKGMSKGAMGGRAGGKMTGKARQCQRILNKLPLMN